MEELKNRESYQQHPAYQQSQHQRLLKVLCDDESCSYGGHSAMARMNLEDLKKHIHEGSEAMFASLNPFGAVYREIEHLKTFLNTVLLIECFDSFIDDKCGSVRSYSYIRSFDYKDYPELGFAKKP